MEKNPIAKSEEITTQINPESLVWIRIVQQIMSWLLASISESMFGHVVRCRSLFLLRPRTHSKRKLQARIQFAIFIERYRKIVRTRVCKHSVKETRPTLLLVRVELPEKILLCMTGYLYWSPCGYKIPRDSSPVAFAELLQPQKKFPVLLFRPGHT